MKNKLPALTMVAVLSAAAVFGYRSYQGRQSAKSAPPAAVPAPDPAAAVIPSQPTAGDQLLVQARMQLERRISVTARLRYQASLAGRALAGFGGYWQQGSGENLQMRFELRLNNQDTSLMQVSNGCFLWTDQRVPAGRDISRLDLRKVRSESNRAEDEFDELASGSASWAAPEPDLAIRTGGLPTLLLVITDCFSFQPPQSMRWTPSQPLEGLPASFPVLAVVGKWKPDVLALFVPKGKGVADLPERLPHEVLLLFGQTDLFPYRIEFRRRLAPPATGAAAERSTAFQLSSDPLVLLELSAVSFDSQVPAGQFDFAPGEASWDDRTAEYIDALRQQRQARMATQKRQLQR